MIGKGLTQGSLSVSKIGPNNLDRKFLQPRCAFPHTVVGKVEGVEVVGDNFGK